jgi:1-acyl-sn-glycerol-3-phosphate acyltransferase
MPRPTDLLRTPITWLSGLVGTVVMGIAATVVGHLRPRSPLVQRIIVAWSRSWLIPAGVSLEVRGADRLDTSRSYIVVANHLSNMDIMVCFVALPVPIRYLAKKELFRVPLLAQAMRAIGIVEVDRQHRGAATIHAVNRQSRMVMERGLSLIVYPEGTRTRDGVMRPFKKGAFTMAVESGLPVVPVAVHGTREVWRPGSWWMRSGAVTVVIDAPIETTGMTRSDVTSLRDQVQGIVGEHVRALRSTHEHS